MKIDRIRRRVDRNGCLGCGSVLQSCSAALPPRSFRPSEPTARTSTAIVLLQCPTKSTRHADSEGLWFIFLHVSGFVLGGFERRASRPERQTEMAPKFLGPCLLTAAFPLIIHLSPSPQLHPLKQAIQSILILLCFCQRSARHLHLYILCGR